MDPEDLDVDPEDTLNPLLDPELEEDLVKDLPMFENPDLGLTDLVGAEYPLDLRVGTEP